MYRVAMVCEGPADRAILEAVLDHYLADYEPLPVQPPQGVIGGDAGPFGGGWKGVRSWCKDVAGHGGLGRAGVLENADILVLQVDADVAHEDEVNLGKRCPPPADTVDEVRSLVQQWLGTPSLASKIVLCVPSMASETWALVALFPGNAAVVPCDPPPANGECIECRKDVKAILRRAGSNLRPRLVISQDGKLKNQARGYRNRAIQDRIANGWHKVLEVCGEARRLDDELRAAIACT